MALQSTIVGGARNDSERYRDLHRTTPKGEDTANVLVSSAVGVRLCTVSFKSATGISHSVEVEAGTLYEAAGLGLARLKKDGWVEGLGPGTRLEIQVREPATHHVITVDRLTKWVNGVTASPVETLRRAKVRQLLGS